ncbi:MAG: cytotoxic translational repressor of toxin-antitoxin stability system, partial [Acidimicrobiales bacterium]
FYRCVNEGVRPARPKAPEPERPAEGIDAKLMRNLLRRVGLTSAQVASMSKAEAVKAWEDYLSSGG